MLTLPLPQPGQGITELAGQPGHIRQVGRVGTRWITFSLRLWDR
jgi:hypothetical protein